MTFADFDTAMDAMADSLLQRGDVGQALGRIVVAATQTVPGADDASITVRHLDGHLETTAATDEVVRYADELQYELREGPCYDAVTVESATYSRDLSRDTQWPRFGPKVAELGLLSQMAVRLSNDGGRVTGLNLYSRTRNSFEDHEALPQLFASHARVALGYATELQSLQGAIGTREIIGKAIGIVMERYKLTPERAFEFLIRLSQNSNRKLRDIAAELVRVTSSPDET